MSIESTVNYHLNRYPAVKKIVKRGYQLGMYSVSRKIKSEGNILRVSPDDQAEYFFGYYDKSPWNGTGRYMLCMRARNTWSDVAPSEPADILLIDTQNNNSIKYIAKTHSWNVQQGCMAQWLGPSFNEKIIYNDFREGRYCSVIYDITSGEEHLLPLPVYTVSQDGKTALSLDFSRLHRMRPGYGYSNLPDITEAEKLPDKTCIWLLNIETGETGEVLKYTDFSGFETRPEMEGAEHKVNHLMISPNGQRFMVLHRWFKGQRKYTRLVTCNIDGTEMFNLSDDDMVSHCWWKSDTEILAFENKHNGGNGYYLMSDRTNEYEHLWQDLTGDGHPSYSPNGTLVVTDTYPNRKRIAEVRIMQGNVILPVARVFAPFKYDNNTRCDLHPRWSRDGKKICFDAVFEGHRGLYTCDILQIATDKKCFHGNIRVVFLMTGCRKRGPAIQTLNIIKNMDIGKFKPILFTLYSETPGDSILERFIPEVAEVISLRSNFKKILFGDKKRLYKLLDEIRPTVVQSVGLFPAAFMLGYRGSSHCTTIRTDIYTDYSRYGKIRGMAMKWINIKVIKKCRHTYVCSKSLSDLYENRLGIRLPYIRNGVDTDKFCPAFSEKDLIRKKIGLPENKRVIIYTGSFVDSKDQAFAIRCFLKSNCEKDTCFVLLGEGPLLASLKEKYEAYNRNVLFAGFVFNTDEYLQAADLFISTSRLEGMPNGVLEALASGLPVLLSDIPQHMEILSVSEKIGQSYKIGSEDDFINKLDSMMKTDLTECCRICRKVALDEFSAKSMSLKYQDFYEKMVEEGRNE